MGVPRPSSSPSFGSAPLAIGLAVLVVLRGALGFAAAGAPQSPAVPASPAAPASPASVDGKAKASAHLRRGAELIDAEDLAGALAEFEEAYRLVPSPSILHNFGIVYEGMGRKAEALDCFQRFLAEAPRPPAAAREHAERAVQALLGQVADLRVESDVSGATIFVDGRRVGETPQVTSIHLDPGPHQLSVERSGQGTVYAERLEVVAGQHVTLQARAARLPPAAGASASSPGPIGPAAGVQPPSLLRAEPAAPRSWQRPVGWVAAGGAVLAAGLFATELILREHYGTDFNDRGCGLADVGQGGPDCLDLSRRVSTAETWATVSGVAAGALGIAAAALFLSMPERAAGHAVSFRASTAGMDLLLQGRF